MKILFLRVGIDRGCGGTLSPIFEDGSFEYVPIPEFADVDSSRGLTYKDLAAKNGGDLSQYSNQNGYVHYDPEFESFTYGEPTKTKRAQLRKLEKNDVLVFYAGFKGANHAPGTCFVIGYFTVERVYSVHDISVWPPADASDLLGNAHFRRKHPEPTLVVVKGLKNASRILAKAKRFSDDQQRVLAELEPVVGFSGSVKRAVGRWVPEAHHAATLAWLGVYSSSN
jgi:hypothetical protein